MNWYTIDFYRMVALLLPIILRNQVILALCQSLVLPLVFLDDTFSSFRQDIDYKINHNSQICYLQSLLNDVFDFSTRGIYIADAPEVVWDRFLWTEAENKPIMLGTFMLQGEKFIGANSIDFIVYVPLRLNLNNNDFTRMNALVRYYKLASKRFDIQTY